MTNEEQQKHEAAIDAWREEAMSIIPKAHHADCHNMRVLHVAEIIDICDLARRAPKPEPKCGTCEDTGVVEKCDWPGEHANRYQEPCPDCKLSPETRPPRDADAEGCYWDPLRAALLERDKARDERDKALAELAACFGYLPLVPGPALAWDGIHLEPHVVRVADEYSIMRERDEAVARAEKAEPRASSALLEAAKDVLKLWDDWGAVGTVKDSLRAAIEAEEARGPSEPKKVTCTGEYHCENICETRSALAAEVERLNNHIKSAETEFDVQLNAERLNSKQVEERAEKAEAALAASTPPQQNHTSDDAPLREWLETYDPDGGILTTIKQDEAAFAELVRRELARGAK